MRSLLTAIVVFIVALMGLGLLISFFGFIGPWELLIMAIVSAAIAYYAVRRTA